MDNEYIIVDFKGNYYKIDSKDSLVVAKSREEASTLTFEEANKRIGGGKKANFYSAIPVEYTPEIMINAGDIESEHDTFVFNWVGWLEEFLGMEDKIAEHKEHMRENLSEVDSEVCDILHYMEIYELDDNKRLELAKQLEMLRMKRRTIKDQWDIAEFYLKNILNNENIDAAIAVLNQIKKLDTRRYKPRVLEELFSDGYTKEFKAVTEWDDNKTLNSSIIDEEDEIFINSSYEITEQKNGGCHMNIERIATVFDNSDIDLKSYISGQVSFYRDINQHVTNLKLDIKNIDNYIEQLLEEAESSNYNAVQGFKVFKELKGLRLEKTAKVRALHNYEEVCKLINCEKLADVLEKSCEMMQDISEVSESVGMSA